MAEVGELAGLGGDAVGIPEGVLQLGFELGVAVEPGDVVRFALSRG